MNRYIQSLYFPWSAEATFIVCYVNNILDSLDVDYAINSFCTLQHYNLPFLFMQKCI
jgi:hypothetical protein